MSNKIDFEKRLLVTGIPRSGTTLITCMIGEHPDCVAMSECFSCEEYKIAGKDKIKVNKLCTPNHIQYDYSTYDAIHIRLLQRIKDKLSNAVRKITGLNNFELPRVSYSIREYILSLKAKLIVIIRKPEHVISSMIKRDNFAVEEAARRYERGVKQIHKSLDNHPNMSIVINFEDLIKEPPESMKAVCKFLGIEYTGSMLDGYRSTPQYEREGIQKDVLDKDTKTKYKEEINDYAIDVYEKIKNQK